MKTKRRVALLVGIGIIIVALPIFFYVPIITYSGDASAIGVSNGGGPVSWGFTAQVAPSYAIFHCGEVYNPTVRPITNDSRFAFLLPYQLYSGGIWQCK